MTSGFVSKHLRSAQKKGDISNRIKVSPPEHRAGNRGDDTGALPTADLAVVEQIESAPDVLRQHRQQVDAASSQYWASLRGDAGPQIKLEGPVDGLPACATCGSGRWLRLPVSLDHPDFGRVIRCPDCKDAVPTDEGDVVEQRRLRLVREHDFSEDQLSQTFNSFEPRPGTEAALTVAHLWSKHPAGWLVIHGRPRMGDSEEGDVGVGKTHLSLAVANQLIHDLRPFRWWFGADLLASAYAAMNESKAGLPEFRRRVSETPILIIDDLGTFRVSEWSLLDFLEPVMDYRYRHNLPTLLTCVGTPDEIRRDMSVSIGRRLQDRQRCRTVAISAEQYMAHVDGNDGAAF